MRTVKRLGAVTAVLALAIAIAVTSFASNEITVGDFVTELAKAKRVDSTSAQAAADALAAIGVRIPNGLDLSKRLTESDVADISRSAGLFVTTRNPEASFDQNQVESFFVSFAGELGDDGVDTFSGGENDSESDAEGDGEDDGPPFDPFSKGKGKGKGKGDMTPTEPD